MYFYSESEWKLFKALVQAIHPGLLGEKQCDIVEPEHLMRLVHAKDKAIN